MSDKSQAMADGLRLIVDGGNFLTQGGRDLMRLAADEIERLREEIDCLPIEENERLRGLLQDVIAGDWSVTGLQEALGELT